jgi:hypothetical protein
MSYSKLNLMHSSNSKTNADFVIRHFLLGLIRSRKSIPTSHHIHNETAQQCVRLFAADTVRIILDDG